MDVKQQQEVKYENFFSKILSVIGKTTEEEVSSLLKKKKLTLSVAESLTGGLISAKLTTIPGSSEYFIGGVVCYSNRIKIMEAGVPASIIVKNGEVSSECAQAMAEGVRKRFRTDIGLSATGVAGPAGVSPPRPIGQVFIAVSSHTESKWKELHLKGTRSDIRQKAAQAALGLLWVHLGGEDALSSLGFSKKEGEN